MKILLPNLIMVVLILAFSVIGRPVDESLVLFFPFEEGQGDTTEDKSGHDNTGELVNAPEWVEGKYGKGLLLGNGSYVSVSDSDTLDGVSELTIELWANINQVNNANVAAKSTWDFSFHSHFWDGSVVYWGYSVPDRINTPAGTVVPGEWIHLALQFDGPDNMWRIYKNGGEVAAGAAIIEEIPDTDVDFSVGGPDLGGGTADGMIDELAVYNKALSADEIKRDMQGITAAVKPVNRLTTTWARIKGQ